MTSPTLAVRAGRVLDRVIDAMMLAGSAIVAFLAIGITLSVFTRYALHMPIGPIFELAEYSLLFITFLGAAFVGRSDSHIRMDVIDVDRFPRLVRWVDGYGAILRAIVAAALAIMSATVTIDFAMRGVTTATLLAWPRWVILAVIPLGCIALLLQQVRTAYRLLSGRERLAAPSEGEEAGDA